MKKLKWGVLLFLILVFALSSWPSFLAFNQAEQAATDQEVQKMAVALVNEDEGAIFNGEEIDFGQEFVKSVERDSTHDWYIVSRGVAENGIEQNLYNMMIVIPHDFTEKALSIDSDSPEPVQISYKINASDNHELRSRAKETAAAILNDFNRRIIDVYFASVIGNLQEAQDSVQEIVEKEAHYTNKYNQHVNHPLADYMSQFSVIQDNTQISRDSFSNFKDILSMFEENLYDGVNANKKYVSNFSDMLDTHQKHHQFTRSVYDDLNSLRKSMHHEDVLAQLNRLEQSTERVYRQFQTPRENESPTILTRGLQVQQAFNEAAQKVEAVENYLNHLLADENKELRKKLEQVFDGEFNDIFKANGLYREPNRAVLDKLYEQIANLPTLNEAEIVELGFEADTTTRLTNAIKVTNKLLNDDEFRRWGFQPPNREIPLVKLVEDVKNELRRTGVTGVDSVQLPLRNVQGKELTEFRLTEIPEGFFVRNVRLSVPESDWSYEVRRYRGEAIHIPADVAGRLNVEVVFRLRNDVSEIDIFEPIRWRWTVHEQGKTEEEMEQEKKSENHSAEASSEHVHVSEQIGDDRTDDGESYREEAENSEAAVEREQLAKSSQSTIAEVQIDNHYATHTVQTSLLENKKGRFINEAAETAASYERLFSLYELYFGFDMTQLPNDFNERTLGDLASNQSLYYLFNKTNIVDVLIDLIIGSITENTADLVEHVNARIAVFKSELNQARRNANRMVETIEQTKAQAEILNENVAKTLRDLAQWREDSLSLVAGQEQVLLHEEEQIAAIAALDQEFKAFLAQSQALAEQANSNLTSADHVFDTLDAIDKHAQQIQENGASIIQHADSLSKDLIEKLKDDKSFADNFVNVLANSRVGDRPNEDLYNFLSEPVKVKNDGIIMAGDALTPYFIVLIMFIVALFTAYVISTYEERRYEGNDEEESSIIKRNFPMTVIAGSVGIVEGLFICIISGYLLQISQTKLIQWIGLNVLIMVTLLFAAAYLLRQLRMIGMFILLTILSLYLLLTNALTGTNDKFSLLKQISPLQHVEIMLANFMQGSAEIAYVVIGLAGLLVLSVIGNLCVMRRSDERKVDSDETVPETN